MRRLSAVVLVFALLAAACGDDAGTEETGATSTTTAAADSATTDAGAETTTSTTTPATTTTTVVLEAPFEVESSNLTFVDESRVTPASLQSDELASRTLDVWIDAPAIDGPIPLVIFAHGLTGHPRSHELLRTHLAAQGFLVVAPAFPLTNNDVPGALVNVFDVAGQVGDVSFVIDAVLADPELGPRIDADRIGVIGHSLGGLTTAGAALNPDADARISAAVVMSAGFVEAREGVDVLVVHGDADPVIPFAAGAAGYGSVEGRRLLLTLVGGGHNGGIGDDDTDWGRSLRGLAAAFFADALESDTGQAAALDDLPLDDVRIEAGTADGPLEDWRDYFAA